LLTLLIAQEDFLTETLQVPCHNADLRYSGTLTPILGLLSCHGCRHFSRILKNVSPFPKSFKAALIFLALPRGFFPSVYFHIGIRRTKYVCCACRLVLLIKPSLDTEALSRQSIARCFFSQSLGLFLEQAPPQNYRAPHA